MSEQGKKPRLFYWEDAESSWCVAGDSFPDVFEYMTSNAIASVNLEIELVNEEYFVLSDSNRWPVTSEALDEFVTQEPDGSYSPNEIQLRIGLMTDVEYDALPEI